MLKEPILGIAASFVGNTLEMMAALSAMPMASPNDLKEILIFHQSPHERQERTYRTNPRADVLVAMSFKGMEA